MLMHIDPQYVGCREVKQFLYDYVERELDERLLMAFDNHLMACKDCQEMTYSYRRSTETVKSNYEREVPIPTDFKAQLLDQLAHSD